MNGRSSEVTEAPIKLRHSTAEVFTSGLARELKIELISSNMDGQFCFKSSLLSEETISIFRDVASGIPLGFSSIS